MNEHGLRMLEKMINKVDVGALNLWDIGTRQLRMEILGGIITIMFCSLVIISAILAFLWYNKERKNLDSPYFNHTGIREEIGVVGVFLYLGAGVCAVIACGIFINIIQRFINPEYYILRLISHFMS